jgi:hypothetical protein
MIKRYKVLLAVSYGAVVLAMLAGAFWFSVSVALGPTRFPVWIAGFNPVTLVLVYFILRRLVPKVFQPVEGAGFSLGYLAFFTLTTFTLW